MSWAKSVTPRGRFKPFEVFGLALEAAFALTFTAHPKAAKQRALITLI
jgi:hypothetical protein